MKKEITIKISVELDDELEEALYNIRWKHIDIDATLQEELEEYVKGIIMAYGEEG